MTATARARCGPGCPSRSSTSRRCRARCSPPTTTCRASPRGRTPTAATRIRPGPVWNTPSASWRHRGRTASRPWSSRRAWPRPRRCSSPSCGPATRSSCPATATRRCLWCGRSWSRTASRYVRRRPAGTPSSTSSTARSCCGSRLRRTPGSTCATSGGSSRPHTRVAPGSPWTTRSLRRSDSARWSSVPTSRWPVAPSS